MSGNNQPQQRQALLQAVASQQQTIARLTNRLAVNETITDYVVGLMGLNKQVTAIRKRADIDNPAQPVANPPSEQAAESTQEAATPEARDDARNPGMTPGSVGGVPAQTTTVALEPGEALPTQPFNQLENVQAPVAGTETHVPNEMTRIETDVRVSPNASPTQNPQVAFPWTISPNQSNDGSQPTSTRTVASIRLARLQIQANMVPADSDDLVLGTTIASSNASDAEIMSTIQTLESVRKGASRQQARPAGLVPRSTGNVQRTTPSLAASQGATAHVAMASGPSTSEDEDLFL